MQHMNLNPSSPQTPIANALDTFLEDSQLTFVEHLAERQFPPNKSFITIACKDTKNKRIVVRIASPDENRPTSKFITQWGKNGAFLPRMGTETFTHDNTEFALELYEYIGTHDRKFNDLHTLWYLTRNLDYTEVFRLVHEAILGLKEMHSKNWFHLNMALTNIAVSPSPTRAVLIGFGSVLHLDDGQTHVAQHRVGISNAVVNYVAPEVLTQVPGMVSPSGIDVWAVGVMLYVIVCGGFPFTDINEIVTRDVMLEYVRREGFAAFMEEFRPMELKIVMKYPHLLDLLERCFVVYHVEQYYYGTRGRGRLSMAEVADHVFFDSYAWSARFIDADLRLDLAGQSPFDLE